ncbi:MAG TPA: hypothetical protein VHT68_19400, partial [Pseudolabrys sp.]|nr:hypothetical protein [Pseudolabrys sp.]
MDDRVGMSALGHKRTSNLAGGLRKAQLAGGELGQVKWEELRNRSIAPAESQGNDRGMSAYPPKADIRLLIENVRFGPIADIGASDKDGISYFMAGALPLPGICISEGIAMLPP